MNRDNFCYLATNNKEYEVDYDFVIEDNTVNIFELNIYDCDIGLELTEDQNPHIYKEIKREVKARIQNE